MNDFVLYVITESAISAGRSNEEIVSRAIDGGASIIQLREKNWTREQYLEGAKPLAQICKDRGVLFVVNDHIDVALEVGAWGVHLGQEDMPLSEARKLSKDLVIGKSTHSLEQAIAAEKEGADYISVGPVFETRAKPYTVGVDLVKEVTSKVKIPIVAIGGIKEHNIDSVLKSGATRIAVISEVVSAANVESSASQLVSHINLFKEMNHLLGD